MKAGLNPQALDAKLREIDLDFQQTDWPEPIEVVRFRRSDGSEGLLTTQPADLELEQERTAGWAEPSRRRDDSMTEQDVLELEARYRAFSHRTRMPRPRAPVWRFVVGAVVLFALLGGATLWAHACVKATQ
jgi:hypothetical protein